MQYNACQQLGSFFLRIAGFFSISIAHQFIVHVSLLFVLYTSNLAEVFRSLGVSSHQYADDTQADDKLNYLVSTALLPQPLLWLSVL